MAFTRDVLAIGKLPSTTGDLYAPVGSIGLIHLIKLLNTHTGNVDVVLYYDNGTEYETDRFTLKSGEAIYLEYSGEGDVVLDGEKITGDASVADVVVYKFCGSYET